MSIPGVVEVPELVDEWAGPAIWSSGWQPVDCEAPPLTLFDLRVRGTSPTASLLKRQNGFKMEGMRNVKMEVVGTEWVANG